VTGVTLLVALAIFASRAWSSAPDTAELEAA